MKVVEGVKTRKKCPTCGKRMWMLEGSQVPLCNCTLKGDGILAVRKGHDVRHQRHLDYIKGVEPKKVVSKAPTSRTLRIAAANEMKKMLCLN